MVPAEVPAARLIRTVTASDGSVCRTVPVQVPARSAGIFGAAAGVADADDVCAEAVVWSAATGVAVVPGLLRCVAMRVAATAMTATQARLAVAQAIRRDRDAVEVSAGPSGAGLTGPRPAARARRVPSASSPAAGSLWPRSAVTRVRAGGLLAGSGDMQADTVFRSGSGRLATSGRPAANRMVWAQASRSADGVAGP